MDSSIERDAKRRKRDTSGEHSAAGKTLPGLDDPGTIVRSGYWFDDGNVILQVQNTQFKLHKSVMALHSHVLSDVFTRRPPQGELDGCPVVVLQDTVRDWDAVLGIFYDGFRKYGVPPFVCYPMSFLDGLMTLAERYQFDHIRQFVVSRFKSSFTPAWLHDITPARGFERAGHLFLGPDSSFNDILNFAEKFRIRKCLPKLYAMALMDHDVNDLVFEGTRSVEGRVAMLSPKTQKLLIVARDRLQKAISAHYFPITVALSENHKSMGNNACQWLTLNQKLWLSGPDICTALARREPPSFAGYGLCRTCIKDAADRFDAAQVALGKDLPVYFDLPRWEDLMRQEESNS